MTNRLLSVEFIFYYIIVAVLLKFYVYEEGFKLDQLCIDDRKCSRSLSVGWLKDYFPTFTVEDSKDHQWVDFKKNFPLIFAAFVGHLFVGKIVDIYITKSKANRLRYDVG